MDWIQNTQHDIKFETISLDLAFGPLQVCLHHLITISFTLIVKGESVLIREVCVGVHDHFDHQLLLNPLQVLLLLLTSHLLLLLLKAGVRPSLFIWVDLDN